MVETLDRRIQWKPRARRGAAEPAMVSNSRDLGLHLLEGALPTLSHFYLQRGISGRLENVGEHTVTSIIFHLVRFLDTPYHIITRRVSFLEGFFCLSKLLQGECSAVVDGRAYVFLKLHLEPTDCLIEREQIIDVVWAMRRSISGQKVDYYIGYPKTIV
jgi:hypothetical protein